MKLSFEKASKMELHSLNLLLTGQVVEKNKKKAGKKVHQSLFCCPFSPLSYPRIVVIIIARSLPFLLILQPRV